MKVSTVNYQATSLADIAEHFDEKAKGCEENASTRRLTKVQQAEWRTEASTWRRAASILRRTTVTT